MAEVRTRVAVVDDHRLMLEGLSAWIREAAGDLEIAAAVPTWTELVAHPAFPVDVVLLDLALGDGVPASAKIAAARAAGCAVVVVSATDEAGAVRRALAAGALAYVTKTCPMREIVRAVRRAARGESYLPEQVCAVLDRSPRPTRPALSAQEARALVLYATGAPMKSVARQMGVTEDTARSYIKRVREKYAGAGIDVRTKIDLYRRAVQDGWMNAVQVGENSAPPPRW